MRQWSVLTPLTTPETGRPRASALVGAAESLACRSRWSRPLSWAWAASSSSPGRAAPEVDAHGRLGEPSSPRGRTVSGGRPSARTTDPATLWATLLGALRDAVTQRCRSRPPSVGRRWRCWPPRRCRGRRSTRCAHRPPGPSRRSSTVSPGCCGRSRTHLAAPRSMSTWSATGWSDCHLRTRWAPAPLRIVLGARPDPAGLPRGGALKAGREDIKDGERRFLPTRRRRCWPPTLRGSTSTS